MLFSHSVEPKSNSELLSEAYRVVRAQRALIHYLLQKSSVKTARIFLNNTCTLYSRRPRRVSVYVKFLGINELRTEVTFVALGSPKFWRCVPGTFEKVYITAGVSYTLPINMIDVIRFDTAF